MAHNGRNELGDGVIDHETGGKLSQYGVAVIKEMNRLGMLVGLSHLSDAGFYHALEVSEYPVVVTHSNCRALYDHPQNLTDDHIKVLASHGGVIGIHRLGLMLETPSLEQFLDHIDHACELVGPEYVGVVAHGFDTTFMQVFGGVRGRALPEGAHNDGSEYYENLVQLIQGLEHRGYGQEEIAGILGSNFMRVLSQVLN